MKQRSRTKQDMTKTWNYWHLLLDEAGTTEQQQSLEADVDGQSPKASGWLLVVRSVTFWARLRKHAAHRRTILAALTFGVAAFLAVMALMDVAGTSEICNMLSAHVYILSAVIACSGKRTRPWLYGDGRAVWHNSETLEDLGDLLFLIGSLVDGILFDLHFDDDTDGWPILAACLWCLDAFLYLRSDVIMAERQVERCLHDEVVGSGVLV